MPKKYKTFVLDTNVILHDSTCLHQFQEHDIVVPITVLEELDRFKKGNDTLNFHAREFVRSLDSLSHGSLFNGGVKIGRNLGRISIKLESEFDPDLALSFTNPKPDHHILNIAYRLSKEQPAREVVLVTKDVNLRMKAKAAGLTAQDYTTDHVKDISALYKGRRLIDDVSFELVQALYEDPYEIPAASLEQKQPFHPNEYAIVRNQKRSALARYDSEFNVMRRVDKVSAYGITPRNAEQTFALNALLDPAINLVTISGKAGTGKTLLALAAALQAKKEYRQIFMARPIVALSNKDIGYLPGDIQSKLDPYMQPLFDNLAVIRNQFGEKDKKNKEISDLIEEEKLIISPLSYIRGRSLVKIYFIVDEAQNLTPHEVKTIITRAGEGTKVILTGDIWQIDHPYLDSHSNGLSHLIEKMQSQNIYAHINLEKGERSELAELASQLL
ncbi:MAG: PhoH family protein [Lentisphaeria bacterium]